MELLGSDNSEFRVGNFCPIPETITSNFTFVYGTMLESENSELSSFALHVY